MNIFWLSLCIVECARMLCDQHVVKMCTEAAQLSYTALRIRYEERVLAGECTEEEREAYFASAPLVATKSGEASRGFKSTHDNHPLAVWARASYANLCATVEMCNAICDEYTVRFGKEHATKKHAVWLEEHISGAPFFAVTGEHDKMSAPPLCVPEEYQCGGDLVASYRLYYVAEKVKFARYWYRPPPEFVSKQLDRSQTDRAFSDSLRKLKARQKRCRKLIQ